MRIDEALTAVLGTVPGPPNATGAVHHFLAGAGQLALAHDKSDYGQPSKTYLALLSSTGFEQDARRFQSIWSPVGERTGSRDADLFVFGERSGAKMHRYPID